MNIFKSIGMLFAVVLLTITQPSFAHSAANSANDNLITKANQAFKEGNYSQAREIYRQAWVFDENKIAKTKMEECDICIRNLSEAQSFERKEDYANAVAYYKSILSINPYDSKVAKLIEECNARQYRSLYQSAVLLYKEGNYAQAKDKLNEYSRLSGKTDTELLSKITECNVLSGEASQAFGNKDYPKAKSYYERLLAKNPSDATSAKQIAEINRLTQQTKAIYINEQKSKKRILIPENNCFNLRLISSFNNTNVFGAYLGFNYKMFQIGVDFGFAKGYNEDLRNDYITDTELSTIKKNYVIKEDEPWSGTINNYNRTGKYSEYYSPSFQFAISPGINLKYFSIECGLGMIVGSTYKYYNIDSKYNGYASLEAIERAEKESNSKFLFRPTATGFIPTGKSHKGLTVSFGYNIVSGASPLNSLVFGIGFFI